MSVFTTTYHVEQNETQTMALPHCRETGIWNLSHKNDHRVEISGKIDWHDALAPGAEVLLSWYLFCACAVSLGLIFFRLRGKNISMGSSKHEIFTRVRCLNMGIRLSVSWWNLVWLRCFLFWRSFNLELLSKTLYGSYNEEQKEENESLDPSPAVLKILIHPPNPGRETCFQFTSCW